MSRKRLDRKLSPACAAARSGEVEEEVEEEKDEKHSEPTCPWEAACSAATFVTLDPALRL